VTSRNQDYPRRPRFPYKPILRCLLGGVVVRSEPPPSKTKSKVIVVRQGLLDMYSWPIGALGATTVGFLRKARGRAEERGPSLRRASDIESRPLPRHAIARNTAGREGCAARKTVALRLTRGREVFRHAFRGQRSEWLRDHASHGSRGSPRQARGSVINRAFHCRYPTVRHAEWSRPHESGRAPAAPFRSAVIPIVELRGKGGQAQYI